MTSSIASLIRDVPQGSMLGTLLLIVMDTVNLIRLIESHGLMPHLYVDDTPVYGS